ncbi:MAG: hypothetical protein IT164_11815 [Bryobacterales bacterium]|nr:hypothetical protein [Bryobacterales bacterium]
MTTPAPRNSSPVLIFIILCLVCFGGLGIYFYRAGRTAAPTPEAAQSPDAVPAGTPPEATPTDKPSTPEPSSGAKPEDTPTTPGEPATATPRRIYFRSTNVERGYGQMAYLDFPRLDAPPTLTSLSCEVLDVSLSGAGICLVATRGVLTRYDAILFDAARKTRHTIPLGGIPSRTRLNRDGTMAATTVFLTGHGYDSVDFTTETLLIDTRSGKPLVNLEEYVVSRGGKRIDAKDVNYWGVTFTPDGKGFYCTLSTNRQHFLVRADIAAKTGVTLRDNVECPSLSPNGKRVVYKKRIPGNRVAWRLHILDLATNVETPLPETRSVDDQLEWLDDGHVLYSLPENASTPSPGTDVWKIDVDQASPPAKFLPKAYSPSVIRQ